MSSLYNPDKKDFAPRVSAAWDVTGKGKTVVRAGFGMFFDAFSQDMVLGHLPYAPFFDPGPAYNNIGPDSDLCRPVRSVDRSFPGGLCTATTTGCGYRVRRRSRFDRNIKTPYMENYNLNIQQQISATRRCCR